MSKWKSAKEYSPPENRNFLALLNMGVVVILTWSYGQECWFVYPPVVPAIKYYIEDINLWREMPNLPPEWRKY